jgi:phospholipid transport system substrate-binding protein
VASRKRPRAALLAALLLVPLAAASSKSAAAGAPEAGPVEVVRETIESLSERLTAIRGSDPGAPTDPAQAREAVARTVWPRVDFGAVSKLVLGTHWAKASADQRERFTEAFKALLLASYAETVAERTGTGKPVSYPEQFTRVEGDDATVATSLAGTGGAPPLRIDYRLHRLRGQWKVIDIVVAGVSLAGTYRHDFRQRIERQGIDGLIAALTERAGERSRT